MSVANLNEIVPGLKDMDFHQLGDFCSGSVGVFRSGPGVSPWELHPDQEELLYVLDGSVDITLMKDDGAETTHVEAGGVFIVPRGFWHRHEVADFLVELYATPGVTQHSHAANPLT